MLAYFGYPKTHENDAENTVRAGLQLLQIIGGIEAAPIGRLRIGIATSLMLVAGLDVDGKKEPTVVDEAVNLALHMQAAAPADCGAIGARTN